MKRASVFWFNEEHAFFEVGKEKVYNGHKAVVRDIVSCGNNFLIIFFEDGSRIEISNIPYDYHESMEEKTGNVEPMRWIKQGEYFECPVCHDEMALPNNYCKDCGQKLSSPEEK